MSASEHKVDSGKVYRATWSAKAWITVFVLAPGLFVTFCVFGTVFANLGKILAQGWSILNGLPVAAFVLLILSAYVTFGIHIWRMKLEIQKNKFLIRTLWRTRSISNSEVRACQIALFPAAAVHEVGCGW